VTAATPLRKRILDTATELFDSQVELRRHLHRHPELSTEEFQTTATLRDAVAALGLKILPIEMETGLLAELKGGRKGRTIAVRTDIDALPVTESTGLPFCSEAVGKMHACGHDVHMATVYGVAAALAAMRESVPGTVRFIFQPAEEMPPGGARPMIENGALRDVEAILGLHVDPHLAVGRIGLRDGVTMASVSDFDLIIHGRGGHAARPHTAVDALTTAAEVVQSIQKVVSREIDPITPVAVTFGRIEGGTARNVIADRVTLVGTARTLSVAAAQQVAKLIKRTATAVCRAHGATLEMNLIADYPVLKNDPRINRLLAGNFEMLYGRGKIDVTKQVLGGEDFACYLAEVPGAMYRLGVMNKKIKADKPWHSPDFIVDENAIKVGTALMTAAVIDFLTDGLP